MLRKHLYRRLPGIASLIMLAAILCGEASSRADAGPQPPCGSAPFPPYPDLENSPAVRAWDRAESGRDWTPPACTGWTDRGFTTMVVAVARFRYLPRPRVAGRLALLQHHANEQEREPGDRGIRGFLHQPGGGIVPLPGGRSDGQGTSRVAINRRP